MMISSWPEEHKHKVIDLIEMLNERDDLNKLQLDWSTGIMILAKK